ncbi:hypothetical protein BJF93_07410 [Xaviernesmea oryzae]|uniref:HTH luxR-type domain-containing protein n=2 Tax=Xaviernesmea oryzae TaxID=464029 RepID=A0A1Q9B1P0_9HYPH|nr:hypothetical protein BJF93_07410 [Xaviernesmea oryzae]
MAPPRPSQGVIERPRLTELAHLLVRHRLVLVHAPAGSGKTTLLAQWHEILTAANVSTVWYSTHDTDRDPLSFTDGLIRALEPLTQDGGATALSLIDPPDALAHLIDLVARRSAQGALALFIDDYHLAEGRDGGETIHRLLTARLPHFTIVLASRNRPQIAISRLRVSGDVLELPVEDLFFDETETEAFFRAASSVPMSPQESRDMHRYTEGWAAGLRLASLLIGTMPGAMAVSPPAGSHRAFADYFLEEVMLGLPEAVHGFLTRTSILDALHGDLCNAVTERGDGNEILSFLEEAQLFLVALPGAPRWYKYHHLFQEFLQARLYTEDGGTVAELHSRAARWFLENGSPLDAVRHAFLGRQPAWAAELIERYCLYDYLSHGRFELFSRWMQQLPQDAREERPLLLLLQVWRSINLRRFAQAEQTLRTIELAASNETSRMSMIARETGLDISGRLHLMRALIGAYDGDIAAGLAHIAQLEGRELDQLAFGQVDLDSIHSYLALHAGDLELAERLTWRANGVYDAMSCHWGAIHSRCIAAMVSLARGLMRDAEEVLQDALAIAERHFGAQSYMVALPSGLLGLIAFDQGQLARAEQLLTRAMPVDTASDVSGLCERVVAATIGLARLYDATDRADQATAVLMRASRRAYESENFRLELQLALERADRAFRRGYPAEGMREWERLRLHLPEAQRRFPKACWMIWDAFHVVEARAACEAGQKEAATARLRYMGAAARAQGRSVMAARMEQEFPWMLDDQMAAEKGAAPVLGVFLPSCAPQTSPSAPRRSAIPLRNPAPGGLTQREEEVLDLMRLGLSNGEIAQRLDVNINTVKTHSKSIFSKLGVKSRTQAVLRVLDSL